MARDHSPFGPESMRVVKTGLAVATWYHTAPLHARIAAPMQPSDQPTIRDTVILFIVIIVLAGPRQGLSPSSRSGPFWLSYVVLYRAAMEIWRHKLGHRTAFETHQWNQIVFHTACLWVIICAAAIARALGTGSVLPLLVIGVMPKLDALTNQNLPEPNTSIWKAYAEIMPVLLRRLRYKDHYLCRSLSMGAKPYRQDLQPTILRGA
jgi:fatty acid desaturase